MASSDTVQNRLCRELGPEYRIREIDLERVIYRDFHNGFDVEISGTHTTSQRKRATIYLWFTEGKDNGLIVRAVRKVHRENISDVVERLYLHSQKMIAEGTDNWNAIINSSDERWCNEDEC